MNCQVTHGQKTFRHLHAVAWILPITTLLIAFLAISFWTANPWPWQETVHETGDRSLIGTVLYFEHAARELPLDLVLGIAIGASVFFVCPTHSTKRLSDSIRRSRWLLAAGAGIVIAAIIAGTLHDGGLDMLGNNLLQMHTRPGEALKWGAHWRYHLLSRLSLMLISLGLAAFLLLILQGQNGQGSQAALKHFRFSLLLFAALTLIFVPGIDPFIDPVFIGHQVREVATHILVTLPLAWAVCLHLAGLQDSKPQYPALIKPWPIAAGVTGMAIGLYLLLAGLSASSASQGQTSDPVLLVFPHFFEHSFSYLVVPLVAGLTYQSCACDRARSAV